jgi:hypothetical protein
MLFAVARTPSTSAALDLTDDWEFTIAGTIRASAQRR